MNLFISFALTSTILLVALVLVCYLLLLMVARYFITRREGGDAAGILPQKLRPDDLACCDYSKYNNNKNLL